ncbi:hypothetical protein H310_08594 [Aphanomyces invadans]|uniref:Major facilitator superfamily (MFS) profile domain-containing protein n=2 Tax=Aphanomyces invadans TaxID=157072 RepID=A0A024TYP7_9STRA|nr:hypothetical protein H310_08594 [Aphanomyces invadans]ETV98442.1 hypothetical protein H310_08594 [Aphanomyces invadans]|eukprot:XP_008872639.1 hypothetical protein H310_08594 [Aphanomyces invadans]
MKEAESPRTAAWTSTKILAYAVGHVLNDMCASSWFSYLLVFLNGVAGLSPVDSALVMFSGQIADGLATPLVGVVSDKSTGFPAIGFGRRKTWLAGGSVLVVVCFYGVFGTCVPQLLTASPSRLTLVVYYCVSASVFNVGWAAVQVSHMAMVPELTTNDNIRCVLNSTRYAFTILSNVVVFVVFLLLLHDVDPLEVPDAYKFTLLTTVSLVVGGICTAWFLLGTDEVVKMPPSPPKRRLTPSPSHGEALNRGPNALTFEADLPLVAAMDSTAVALKWFDWFKVGMFYEVGVVYMCTRLTVNVTQVYIPFLLTVTLDMSATSIAIVPLLVYVSGFLATFPLRWMNEKMGREGTYAAGAALVTLSLALAWLLTPDTSSWIYVLSVLLGFGNSIIMVTSVCLEGDLVGDSCESGAFVYGAMSFTDKISNGVAVLWIQNEREAIQAQFPSTTAEDGAFVRAAYCILPAVCAIVGALTLYYMKHGSKTLMDRSNYGENGDACEKTTLLQRDTVYGTA